MSRPFARISIFSVRGASRGNEMGLISSGRERAAAAAAPIQSKHAPTPLRRLYDSYLLVMLLVYLTRNSLISFETVASPFKISWPSAPLTRIGSVLMTLE